jgi:hypothetical protein
MRTGFASCSERGLMIETTKRPEALEKVWRKHGAVSDLAVHALASPHEPSDLASAAPFHRAQCWTAVMKNERPENASPRSTMVRF